MRRVRLTEGQLHNVIRESVSQILNELDWKTYNNAAKKVYHKLKNSGKLTNGEYDRQAGPLIHAEVMSKNQKYPHLVSATKHLLWNQPLTPEEQEEFDAYNKDLDNQMNGRYKYEKGGRGYYLDDED